MPSSSSSQRFKDVQIKVPTREKTSSATEPIYSQASPSTTRHTVKEVLVCVSRGPSPEKHFQQQIYHIRSSSSDDDDYNENEQDRKPYVRAIVSDRSFCPVNDFLVDTPLFISLFSSFVHVCMINPRLRVFIFSRSLSFSCSFFSARQSLLHIDHDLFFIIVYFSLFDRVIQRKNHLW